MPARQGTPTSDHSSHSDSNVRKRVCKACDRCRLKKSKCDGASPCGRCRADNAICVFGERKKTHDKVYPKGYVEMLEQQQTWLVHGLQELYQRASEGKGWPGDALPCEPNGHPLTHDLLTRLGALDRRKGERFEENTERMQQELWKQNAAGSTLYRQDSSDEGSASIDSPQSPTSTWRSNNNNNNTNIFARPQLPPTPPNYSPLSSSSGRPSSNKTESQTTTTRTTRTSITPSTSTFATAQLASLNSGVVNPIALQNPSTTTPQWPQTTAFDSGAFDEMDLMAPEYTNLSSFDDQPMFGRQGVPMSTTGTGYTMYPTRQDYDDFNQFLNPNATEITSI